MTDIDRPTATVDRMVRDLRRIHTDANPDTDPSPGELAVLEWHGDALAVLWEYDEILTHLEETDRVYPDPGGYYSVGAYLRPWPPATSAGAGR